MSRWIKLTLLTVVVLGIVAALLPDSWRGQAAVLLVSIYAVLFLIGIFSIRMNFFVEALCRGPVEKKTIALTFDDGPDAETTPALLDALAAHGIRATFFCIGERVLAQPEISKRIISEGHVIGNHTFHHNWWTNFLFGRLLERELKRAQVAMKDVVGQEAVYFRPPMGLTNPHYKKALNGLDLRLVGWDIRSYDLRSCAPQKIVGRVTRLARPGSIVALHAAGLSADAAVSILNGVFEVLKAEGYDFVTIDSLEDGV